MGVTSGGTPPRWAFAGGKPQGLIVLDALAREGFLPALVIPAAGLPPADGAAIREWADAVGATVCPDVTVEALAGRLASLDLLLTCRFQLIPEAVFMAPRLGAVNIHSSLLPAYRGVHPVSWAIARGERRTGVTLHRVDRGVDTGDILRQASLDIRDEHDLWSLTEDLDRLSAVEAVDLFHEVAATGSLPLGRPQSAEGGFYARRRRPEDSRIDWHGEVRGVFNLVRALPPPLPPAFTELPNGDRVLVTACSPLAASTDGRDPPGTVLKAVGPNQILVQCGDGAALLTTNSSPPPGTRLA